MKPHVPSPLAKCFTALVGVFGLGIGLPAFGQSAVTVITYGSLSNGSNRTAGDVKFLQEYHPVETVSTNGMDYHFNGPMADSVSFRYTNVYSYRNDHNASAYYQYSSSRYGTYSVYATGDTSPTMEEVMLSNDLTQGIRNPFANGTNSTDSNVERIDFNFNGGYTVQAGDALVFFDLENYNNYGDGFRVAAFTGVDNNGNADQYASTGLLIQPGTLGGPVDNPVGNNAKYIRVTTSDQGTSLGGYNQDISVLDSHSSGGYDSSDLWIVGIVVKLEDLGLQAGQTIYGYSLMAGDVAAGNDASKLVDWTNTNVYKSNTDPDSWGNADFMGFGAQMARPVPEPATYGAILTLGGLALFGFSRWRRRRPTAR